VDAAAEAQISHYLATLEGVRNYSPHTVAAYRKDLQRVVQLLPTLAIWDDLTTRELHHLMGTLHQQGLSARTLQRLLSALRTFLRHLQREGEIENNVAEGVTAPKADHPLPSVLEVDEMATLLDVTPSDPLEIRDHAMFELLYSAGLRLSELTGIQMADLDRQTGEVRVTGKGNRARILPVGSMALAAIERWLPIRAQWPGAEQSALFLSRHGKTISPRTVQTRLKRWASRRGIARTIHPHTLRHAFASHLLQSSQDLRAVQELLGHTNISTTQIYTHLDHQYLTSVYDKAHPRARGKQ